MVGISSTVFFVKAVDRSVYSLVWGDKGIVLYCQITFLFFFPLYTSLDYVTWSGDQVKIVNSQRPFLQPLWKKVDESM